MNESAVPLLELRDGSKSYGAVHALRHGNISLRPGEVRGLVGENGAGKSTLVKVLGGVVSPDDGELLVDGQEASFHSPVDARKVGVAVIYQEPTLFPDLSVAENVVMGRHPRGALRRIDRGAMHEEVQGLLDRLGVRLSPESPVRGLSIADQQIVEIAKALSFEPSDAEVTMHQMAVGYLQAGTADLRRKDGTAITCEYRLGPTRSGGMPFFIVIFWERSETD